MRAAWPPPPTAAAGARRDDTRPAAVGAVAEDGFNDDSGRVLEGGGAGAPVDWLNESDTVLQGGSDSSAEP